MFLLGQNVQLWVEDKTIAFAKTASFNVNIEEIDTSTKDEGGYSTFECGLITWEMTSENLIGDPRSGHGYESLMDLMLAKQPIKVVYGVKDTVTDRGEEYVVPDKDGWAMPTKSLRYEGEAVITSLSNTSANGEVATFSVTLKGRSPLKKVASTAGNGTVSTMSLKSTSTKV